MNQLGIAGARSDALKSELNKIDREIANGVYGQRRVDLEKRGYAIRQELAKIGERR